METDAVSRLIVDVCARLILPRFRRLAGHEVHLKDAGDIVTVADLEAEVELTDALRAASPDAVVVGEEAASADPHLLLGLGNADHAWVIDPVDGTRNFAAGRADFGVMVAETRRGACTRAWIWQPVHERLYLAERGAGVTRNGEPLPAMTERSQPYRASVPRSLRRHEVPGFVVGPTRAACAIDYPALLQGEVDVLGFRTFKPWDHLPGSLMVAELGGHVATLEGEPYRADATGTLLLAAASRALYREAAARLVPGGRLVP